MTSGRLYAALRGLGLALAIAAVAALVGLGAVWLALNLASAVGA